MKIGVSVAGINEKSLDLLKIFKFWVPEIALKQTEILKNGHTKAEQLSSLAELIPIRGHSLLFHYPLRSLHGETDAWRKVLDQFPAIDEWDITEIFRWHGGHKTPGNQRFVEMARQLTANRQKKLLINDRILLHPGRAKAVIDLHRQIGFDKIGFQVHADIYGPKLDVIKLAIPVVCSLIKSANAVPYLSEVSIWNRPEHYAAGCLALGQVLKLAEDNGCESACYWFPAGGKTPGVARGTEPNLWRFRDGNLFLDPKWQTLRSFFGRKLI